MIKAKKRMECPEWWMWDQYVYCVSCGKELDLLRHRRVLKVREKPGEIVIKCRYCKKKMTITGERKKFLGILPYESFEYYKGG